MSVDKKKQTFKEYYDSNPEFKQRHLNKMREPMTCECGAVNVLLDPICQDI